MKGGHYMDNRINPSFVRQYPKGQTIYSRDDKVGAISLIVKGSVAMTLSTYIYQYKSGGVIGLLDWMKGEYQATYIAEEDTVIYELMIENHKDLAALLSENGEYRGVFISSVAKELLYLSQIYNQLVEDSGRLSDYVVTLYGNYEEFCNTVGYEYKTSEILRICDRKSIQIEEKHIEKIKTYAFLASLPLDTLKVYYEKADTVADIQLSELLATALEIKEVIPRLAGSVKRNVTCLINETDDCLYRRIALLALMVEQTGGANEGLVEWLDDILKILYKEEQFFRKHMEEDLSIDRKTMGELYSTLMTCLKNQDKSLVKKIYELTKDHNDILSSLNGCFEQLVHYANYDDEKTREFKAAVVKYINLPDKNNTDDETRELRRIISGHYYALYEAVFLKAYTEGAVSRAVDLFLDYGVLDERLLSKEQLIFLYNKTSPMGEDTPNIYTIRKWLALVYEGEKEPSKNEFDLDYREFILNQVKERKLNMDFETALADKELRLHNEIQNMFRYNQRLVFGQLSSFAPMLCKESLQQDLRRMMLSGQEIVEKLNQVIEIDYSVFYQEVLYSDPGNGIVKEYIMKEVLPDIIVLPCYGVNGSMWQEISTKKRDTPARFIIPLFTEHEMSHIFIRLCGRYRWEICRRLQGGVWNNIQYKSLTSEYMDYIQFYKKNRELSEDKKEGIKLQILKSRNNIREVFTADYESWIRYESKGGIRLNKVVREILYTYCPFNKETRDNLVKSPMFQDAMGRFHKNKLKKAREIESHIIALEKSNITVPKEVKDTLEFYQEY